MSRAMYNDKNIAIVVPCYNEESQIKSVVDGIPDYIDKIVIIDDKSKDNTFEIIQELERKNNRIISLLHEKTKVLVLL